MKEPKYAAYIRVKKDGELREWKAFDSFDGKGDFTAEEYIRHLVDGDSEYASWMARGQIENFEIKIVENGENAWGAVDWEWADELYPDLYRSEVEDED